MWQRTRDLKLSLAFTVRGNLHLRTLLWYKQAKHEPKEKSLGAGWASQDLCLGVSYKLNKCSQSRIETGVRTEESQKNFMISKTGRIQGRDTTLISFSIKVNCVRQGVLRWKKWSTPADLGGQDFRSLWATTAAGESQSPVSVSEPWNKPTSEYKLTEKSITPLPS